MHTPPTEKEVELARTLAAVTAALADQTEAHARKHGNCGCAKEGT